MPITTSAITSDSRQADGRRRIDERHISHDVVEHIVSYLCDAGFDAQAALTASAVRIDVELKEAELRGMATDYTWNHVQQETTTSELVAYVRVAYKNSSKDELVPIASRILEWIANGRFTDTQVRNAFGLTAAQWTTLKNKMTTLVSASTTIKTAVGE